MSSVVKLECPVMARRMSADNPTSFIHVIAVPRMEWNVAVPSGKSWMFKRFSKRANFLENASLFVHPKTFTNGADLSFTRGSSSFRNRSRGENKGTQTNLLNREVFPGFIRNIFFSKSKSFQVMRAHVSRRCAVHLASMVMIRICKSPFSWRLHYLNRCADLR